jgi:hypothetical protein
LQEAEASAIERLSGFDHETAFRRASLGAHCLRSSEWARRDTHLGRPLRRRDGAPPGSRRASGARS